MFARNVLDDVVEVRVESVSDSVANHLIMRIIWMRDSRGQDNISERKVNRKGEMDLLFQQVKEDSYDDPCSIYD